MLKDTRFPPTKILLLSISTFFFAAGAQGNSESESERPNVVFIVVDDLNDYITGIPGGKGHPQSLTPFSDEFAKTAVSFRRAYSNHPVCAPSRASFMTGTYGQSSGNLFWRKWYENEKLKNSKTISEYFRDNGYTVVGSGKLNHFLKEDCWDEFVRDADYGPHAYDGKWRVAHTEVPEPFRQIGGTDGSFGALETLATLHDDNSETGWVTGRWDVTPKPMHFVSDFDRDPTPDELNAQWAADRIQQFATDGNDQPFFLAVGFIRPHTPLHVPQKYFDRFPLDEIKLPVIKENDAEDAYYKDTFDPKTLKKVKGFRYYKDLLASYPTPEEGLKRYVQAYLACVNAVDEDIGRVINAVNNSPFKDNTIIVLTSDHGWSMGQKDYKFKHSPWEESTRIPMIIRAPGISKAGTVAEHPVSLVDIYPTLADLCGLEGDTRKNAKGIPLDGHSMRPFLENPQSLEWTGPNGALSCIFAYQSDLVQNKKADSWDPANQHWTYRTKRWRYIRYNTNQEELYDHDNDPYEWTNLASNPEYAEVKSQLMSEMVELIGKPL